MRLVLTILFLLWCAPVKLGAAFRLKEGEKGVLMLGVTLWGLRFVRKLTWPYRHAARLHTGTQQLQETVTKGQGGEESDQKGVGSALRMVRMVTISNRARSYFRRAGKLECAHLYAQVGFSDAAACALADGVIKGVWGVLRRILPQGAFHSRVALGQKSGIQGMCIVSIRLGNLLTAALMGAFAYIASGKKRKEEKIWSIIPSKI